jgi:hypothetical protein
MPEEAHAQKVFRHAILKTAPINHLQANTMKKPAGRGSSAGFAAKIEK